MRALILLTVAAITLALAAPARAAPTWLAPQNFESGLAAPPTGDMAVAPNGTAVATWTARVGASDVARARVRLPGEGFGPIVTFTPLDGRNAAGPRVAVDGQGNATVAWQEQQGPGGVVAIRTARLQAGSQSFEAPTTVSNPAVTSISPVIAVGAGGTAVVAYLEGATGSQNVRAAARDGAAEDFKPPADVSQTNVSAAPVVGVDDDGDAVVAWQRPVAGKTVIEANFRPRNGSFGSVLTDVNTLSNSVLDAAQPSLAIAPDGTTVVLWSQTTTSDVRYNERTPANVWLTDAKTASPPGVVASTPAVGIDGAGNAIAVWNATSGPATFLQAGLRPAGGAFGGDFRDLTSSGVFGQAVTVNRAGDAIVTFSGSMAETIGAVLRPRGGSFSGVIPAENRAVNSTALFNAGVGIDDEGNATAIWTRNVDPAGSNTYEVAAGVLDAAPPHLAAVSVPPAGTVGSGVGMAAAATDRLTPVAIRWSFGDGAGADGGAVTHAFGAPGAFNVTVTATDAVGNAASATRPILVAPGAPPPGLPRIDSPVRVLWGVSKKRIFLLRMKVLKVPKGGKAELRCKGKKCPFKRKSSKKRRKGAITLFKEVKPRKVVGKKQRSFRAGQRLQLRITAPGHIGKVVKYRLRKGRIPSGRTLCLPPGAAKPRKTC